MDENFTEDITRNSEKEKENCAATYDSNASALTVAR